MKMHRWGPRIWKVVMGVLLIAFIMGAVVMLLWNALVPELFHGPAIGYWQALGLLILSHLLLRGPGGWRAGHGWRHERWRRRLEEKMAGMTPEERERFRAEWRHRCGGEPEEPGHQESKAPA